jgi:hypothetical protein
VHSDHSGKSAICPNEFPRFGASIELYKEVYTRALKVIITVINAQTDST